MSRPAARRLAPRSARHVDAPAPRPAAARHSARIRPARPRAEPIPHVDVVAGTDAHRRRARCGRRDGTLAAIAEAGPATTRVRYDRHSACAARAAASRQADYPRAHGDGLRPARAARGARRRAPARLGGTRQRAVLAMLVLNAGQVVPADRLIDETWPEEPPDTAANVVQGHVSSLRKELGATRSRPASPATSCASTRGAVDVASLRAPAPRRGSAAREGRAEDARVAAAASALAPVAGPGAGRPRHGRRAAAGGSAARRAAADRASSGAWRRS